MNAKNNQEKIKSSKFGRLMNLLKGVPWEIYTSFCEEFSRLIDKVLEEHNFDIIFVRYISQARYLWKHVRKIKSRIIFDIDDIEPRKVLREYKSGGYTNVYDKLRKKFNVWIYENYHRNYLPMFDRGLVCSKEDFDYVSNKKWSGDIAIVPNAIDVSHYTIGHRINPSKIILFCGVLNYTPNEDGVIWFTNNIFPYIREVDDETKLVIIGRMPTEKIIKIMNQENVFVYPNVDSVLPYYKDAHLVIAPIRIGGGTRIKILEAACCFRPVVTTTIGAEGLRLVSGVHCLIVDDEKEFAHACLRLMNDLALAKNLAEANYSYVKDKYDVSMVRNLIKKVVTCKK